ncbi:unnamed protein product, partial [Iphiclides podalirius]
MTGVTAKMAGVVAARETTSQAIAPIGYGASPIVYAQNDEDNLGILLTILLLAGNNRNQNGGCGQSCNCCNCCSCGDCSQSVPIPFPIPFPTNNAIVTRPYYHPLNDDYDDEEDEEQDDVKAKSSISKGNGAKDRKKDSKEKSDSDAGQTGELVVEEEEFEEGSAYSSKPNS